MFDNHIVIMLPWLLIRVFAIFHLQGPFLGLKVLIQLEFTSGWSYFFYFYYFFKFLNLWLGNREVIKPKNLLKTAFSCFFAVNFMC